MRGAFRRIRATLGALAVAGGCVVALGWIGGGYAMSTASAQPTPPAVESRPGLDGFFRRVIKAMNRGDAAAYGRCFDTDRMFNEMLNVASIETRSPRERRRLTATFAASLGSTVQQYRGGLEWTSSDVRRVQPLADGEIIVTIRARNRLGLVVKSRWWLARHNDGWVAYDVEDLDIGYRVSAAMAMVAMASGGRAMPWFPNVRRLNVVPGLLVEGRLEEAEAMLVKMEGSGMPAPFEAIRLMMLGSARLGLGRPEEAERDVTAAAKQNPDMPVLDYLRASIFNEQGRYDEALHAAGRYIDLVGGDAETSLEMGRALQGLGRHEDAIGAYRAGLADNPDSIDCLYELVAGLGKRAASDLDETLPRMTDPMQTCDYLVATFLDEAHLDAAETVLLGYARLAPGEDTLVHHEASLRMRQDRYEEAVETVRQALAETPEEDASELRLILAEALLGAGEPAAAYREGGASSDAFLLVGQELLWRGEDARLGELIDQHRATQPDDHWIAWFQGQQLELRSEHANAADAYHRGLLAAEDDELRQVFRRSMVAARYRSGVPIETLAAIPPWRETARQIGELCGETGAFDRMNELVTVCAANPASVDLAHLFEAEAQFLQDDHEAAVATLMEHADAITADAESIRRYEDRLVRSLVRLGRHDEALAAARVSTSRDNDPFYEVVVHAAAGEVDAATDAFGACLGLGYGPDAFYDDPDAGPALRTTEFAELSGQFPWVTAAEDDRPE